MKNILRLLPMQIRDHIYRKQVSSQNIEERAQGIEVKLATTQSELESAYRLLHDTYVGQGLMDSVPSGLRINIYSALPYTSVVVAKIAGQVVGTVSLIKDSPIGLPSDKDYQTENNLYRQKNQRLVEVSALAVHNSFRKNKRGGLVSLLLMRYLFEYTDKYMGADMLAAVVHPRAQDFYRALFNFKQNGEIIKYKFVKEALAMHLTTRLKEDVYEWTKSHAKNIHHLFIETQLQQVMILPKRCSSLSLHPVMTAEMLKYFFLEKTNLLNTLSRYELELIKSAYELHFSINFIELFRFVKGQRFGFRYQSNQRCAISVDGRSILGKMFDLSTTGVFLQVDEIIKSGTFVNLQLIINDKPHSIPAQVVRVRSSSQGNYPAGIGLKLLQSSDSLTSMLKDSHLNRAVA